MKNFSCPEQSYTVSYLYSKFLPLSHSIICIPRVYKGPHFLLNFFYPLSLCKKLRQKFAFIKVYQRYQNKNINQKDHLSPPPVKKLDSLSQLNTDLNQSTEYRIQKKSRNGVSLQECTTLSIAAKMLQGICSYDASLGAGRAGSRDLQHVCEGLLFSCWGVK